ncbi:hypothetical protein PENTCL1PPCAC_15552, partial [Pristionchus entomophagus]
MMIPTIFFVLLCVFLTSASTQSVGVQGQLMCGETPLTDVEVELWEMTVIPEPDFLIATVKTDSQGYFRVSGSGSTLFILKPALRIYHRCNNDGFLGIPNLCQREVTYEIPSSYVTDGSNVNSWYQLGTVNLQAKQPNEQSHCVDNPIRDIFGRR